MTAPAAGLGAIHEGDCVELLRTLPAGCAQLVIADPPYNLGPRFGVAAEWLRDPKWLDWCGEWLAECQRVLADEIGLPGVHHTADSLGVAVDTGLAKAGNVAS